MRSVSGKTANVRKGPGTKNSVIRVYEQLTPLRIIKSQGSWHQVSDYRGRKGWIFRTLLSTKPTVIVKTEKANVRKSPSTESDILWKFEEGTAFQCLATRGSWYKIKYQDKIAWVSSSITWGFCTNRIFSANKDLARVHALPNHNSKVKLKVIIYAPLELIKIQGSWYYVRDFEGDKGWIHKRYLSTIPSVIIKKRKANIMSGPGTKFEKKWAAHKGVPLRCLRESDGWYKIVDNDDDIGWVSKRDVWGNCY